VSQLDSMCEQLLTNPLIEDYEIQLPEPAAR
jgi:phosphoribosylformylglycinamidine (FGAM) synthase PurS component